MKKENTQPLKWKSVESDPNDSLRDSEKQHQISTIQSILLKNPDEESCSYDTTAGSNLMKGPSSRCFGSTCLYVLFK